MVSGPDAGGRIPIRGVLSPVVTPFDAELRPDAKRLIRHCRWLLERDVGLAVFGTNSEASSMSVTEKMKLLDALGEAGIDTERMIPGTGACALTDSVELTRHAVKHGCAGVLMLPPWYYKGVSDEGLFRSYSEVIQRVGDERLRIYLYHFPAMSQVPITASLIEKLLTAYPSTIAGLKDSSGDWDHTRGLLEQFAPDGFDVFAGSETFLLRTLRRGGAGCISATANVNPAAIAALAKTWQRDDADGRQARLDEIRAIFQAFPMIPALKAAIAHHTADPSWGCVRPPLVELNEGERAQLITALESADFSLGDD